jgi:hypothetical protein
MFCNSGFVLAAQVFWPEIVLMYCTLPRGKFGLEQKTSVLFLLFVVANWIVKIAFKLSKNFARSRNYDGKRII